MASTTTCTTRATTRPARRSAIPTTSTARSSRASTSRASSQTTNALVVKGVVRRARSTATSSVKVGRRVPVARRVSSARRATWSTPASTAGETLVRHVERAARLSRRRDLPAGHRRGVRAGRAGVERPDAARRAAARLLRRRAPTVPSDLANPANAIAGRAAVGAAARRPRKVSLVAAPRRLVSDHRRRRRCYFAYGHFYQMPADRRHLRQRRLLGAARPAGRRRSSYGVMGNPDVKPEQHRAVPVRLQAGGDRPDSGSTSPSFYKDIRDLLGVEFITTYNDAEYARLTNVDFGNVIGFTLALDQRRLGPLSDRARLHLAAGAGQLERSATRPRRAPRRARTRARARSPFNWDQRHTLNLTRHGRASRATTRPARSCGSRAASPTRRRSTPASAAGSRPTRAASRPASMVDLRGEKRFALARARLERCSRRVFNLFDTRFFNGVRVRRAPGSPYYSRFPEADERRARRSDPLLRAAPDRARRHARDGERRR